MPATTFCKKYSIITGANLIVSSPARNGSVPKTMDRHLKLFADAFNCQPTVINPIQSVVSFITELDL